jgi:DNA repair protein RadC
MGGTDWSALSRVSGIGRARAAQLLAAFELGRRLDGAYLEGRTEVRSPAEAARLLGGMRYLDREHFRVLLLDAKNRLLGIETVAVGTLNASLVHPREVLKPAIRRSAAAVILAHNHPTGIPAPSPEDVELTKRLAESGRIVGIEVLDHLIIGDRGYESLREAGVL